MTLHEGLNSRIKKLAASGDLPHLMFCGPSGAGKKTRILALLRELYGSSVEKVKVQQKTFQFTEPKVTLDITILYSNNHIELTPADAGNRDSLVVQSVIKEMAASVPITDNISNKRTFKVIVLNEVERLSRNAQHALRRTMEKSTLGCRIILSSTSSTKIIEPLRSRCLVMRVPAPTKEEIVSILSDISKKQGIVLPPPLAYSIADNSNRNLRKAVLSLEATKVAQYPFVMGQKVCKADWEVFIGKIAGEILREQTPQKLAEIRGKLYELLSHCIPAEVIITQLTLELFPKLDSNLKSEVAHWAAFYEERLQSGSKEIFHLEAFIAKFMSILLQFFVELNGM